MSAGDSELLVVDASERATPRLVARYGPRSTGRGLVSKQSNADLESIPDIFNEESHHKPAAASSDSNSLLSNESRSVSVFVAATFRL